jgi:dolichol-phosphate mannosyltransferase
MNPEETNSIKNIAVIIPFYNASTKIEEVVSGIPISVNHLIIVDDCSIEILPEEAILSVVNSVTKVTFIKNEKNLGVGGTTKTGFLKAIELKCDVVVKIDSDNQMDLSYLPIMISSIVNNEAGYVKGNRFRDMKALKKMPFVRRFGNLILSFLIKIATGYWNVFDPTNGYFALKTSILKELDFDKISNRYFFETSLIAQLYYLNVKIKDITMPAIYGDEKSSMKVWQMPLLFSWNLLKLFIKRVVKQYFLYDFNIASIYILFGIPLFSFGVIHGIYSWIYYSTHHMLAPTGTIMLVTLTIILGFQFLLQAIQYDIQNSPNVSRNE